MRLGLGIFLKRALLGFLGLVLLGILGVGLWVRFVALRDIDSYRQQVQTIFYHQTHLVLEIKQIQSNQLGVLPELDFRGVNLLDQSGHVVLYLEHLEAQVSLWGLLKGELNFDHLRIDQPHLAIRHDSSGNWFVSGIPVFQQSNTPSPFVAWLLQQSRIEIQHAVLEWQDAGRPALVFHEGYLLFEHRWNDRYAFSANLSPPVEGGGGIYVDGVLRTQDGSLDGLDLVRLNIPNINLGFYQPWIGRSGMLLHGQGQLVLNGKWSSSRQWSVSADSHLSQVLWQMSDHQPKIHLSTVELTGTVEHSEQGYEVICQKALLEGDKDYNWDPGLEGAVRWSDQGVSVAFNEVNWSTLNRWAEVLPLPSTWLDTWRKFHLTGSAREVHWLWKWGGAWADMELKATIHDFGGAVPQQFLAWSGLNGQVDIMPQNATVSLSGAIPSLNVPQLWSRPWTVNQFQGKVHWQNLGGHLHWWIDRLHLATPDWVGDIHGDFELRDGMKLAQLQGVMNQVNVGHVARYLPSSVSPKVGQWLADGLQAGVSPQLNWMVQGDVRYFPFADHKNGHFYLKAGLRDAVLMFHPSWPPIEHIQGNLILDDSLVSVVVEQADTAKMELGHTEATLFDWVNGPNILHVQGSAHAPVGPALGYLTETPISGWLGHALDGFTGAGEGHLQLKLDIPLANVQATGVRGDYAFQDDLIQQKPWHLPDLSQARGHLLFTETGVSAEGLRANILGGDSIWRIVSDRVSHQTVISAQGLADYSTLAQVYPVSVLTNASGLFPWSGIIELGSGAPELFFGGEALWMNGPAQWSVSMGAKSPLQVQLEGRISRVQLRQRYPDVPWQYWDKGIHWKGAIKQFLQRPILNVDAQSQVGGRILDLAVKGPLDGDLLISGGGEWPTGMLQKITGLNTSAVIQGDLPFKVSGVINGHALVVDVQGDAHQIQLHGPVPWLHEDQSVFPVTLHYQEVSGQSLLTGDFGGRGGVIGFQEDHQPWHGVLALDQGEYILPKQGWDVEAQLQDGAWEDWQQLWTRLQPAHGSVAVVDSGLQWNQIHVIIPKVMIRGVNWGNLETRLLPRGERWDYQLAGSWVKGQGHWDRAKNSGDGVWSYFRGQDGVAVAQKSPPSSFTSNKWPAIQLSVADVQWNKQDWGKVVLRGEPTLTGWSLLSLKQESPNAQIQLTGSYQEVPKSQLSLSGQASSIHVGDWLTQLGYPHLIMNGEGSVSGHFVWPGEGGWKDWSHAEGAGELHLKNGQFSEVPNGAVGRLVGLLSLQDLPRRLTLDFRDVFSKGFAFDQWDSSFAVHQGTLTLHEFNLDGAAAKIHLEGQLYLENQTAQLTAQVIPAIGQDLSLASTVIGGPVVGAATYFAQKVLSDPVGQILKTTYTISGTWDNPTIVKNSKIP